MEKKRIISKKAIRKYFGNEAKKEGERIFREGDRFFIGKLYGKDEITTQEYEMIIKLWEEFKKEQLTLLK